MAVGERLFQNRERPHFRLSNYRINNKYGRLHKNHSPDSHFCDSAKANRRLRRVAKTQLLRHVALKCRRERHMRTREEMSFNLYLPS
jgi:erythromycin esterase-like protein